MQWNDAEEYTNTVLKQIHFFPDRNEIEQELKDHLEDSVSDGISRGLDEAEARTQALHDMGDPIQIGKELNKIHNPLLGWFHILTQIAMVFAVIFTLYYWISIGVMTIQNSLEPNQGIAKNKITTILNIDEDVRIDDTIYHFYRVLRDTDDNLYLLWTSRFSNLLTNGWSNSYIGDITDDYGNQLGGSSGSSGGLIRYCYTELRDFDPQSKAIHIDYNLYHRSYHITISLPDNFMKVGGVYES